MTKLLVLSFVVALNACDSNLTISTNCEGGCLRNSEDFESEITVDSNALIIASDAEFVTNQKAFEINLESNIFDEYQFKFTRGEETCLGGGYGAWFAMSSSIYQEFVTDGAYRLCVLGRSRNGLHLDEDQAASRTWLIDTQPPVASISNAPSLHSNAGQIEVKIVKGDTVEYQYKIISQSESCSEIAYNGRWIPSETPIKTSLGLDGDYRLCVIGRDLAKNIQEIHIATEHNWTKDTTPPAVELLNVPTNPSNDISLNVFISEQDGVVDYQYKLTTQTVSCASNDYSGSWIPVDAPITDVLTEDSNYKLCVIGRDLARNEQAKEIASEYLWTRDSTPPVASIAGEPTGTNNISNLDITVGGADVSHYQYKLGIGSMDCANSLDYSSEVAIGSKIKDDLAGFPDGSIKLCVLGRDVLGNYQVHTSATEATWVKDTLAPIATLSGEPTGASNSISLNFTVAGSGVAQYRYKVRDTSDAACSIDLGYSSAIAVGTAIADDISAKADGVIELCVVGIDASGNQQDFASASTTSWTKDTQAPVASLAGQPTTTNNVTSLNVNVAGTGVTQYRYKVRDASSISCNNSLGYSSAIAVGTAIADDISAKADGVIELCVVGIDASGNQQDFASASTTSWIKDTQAPTAVMSGLPTNPSSEETVNVSVSGVDVSTYQYKIVSQSSSCGGGGYGGWLSVSIPISQTIASDGNYQLCVIGRDTAFNVQNETSASQYTWTKITPTAGIVIDSGAASTDQNTVTLNLSSNVAQMYITNTAGCESGGVWESFVGTKFGWALGALETTTSVYMKTRDGAGLPESACVSDSILHSAGSPNAPMADAGNAPQYYDVVEVSWSPATADPNTDYHEVAIGTSPGGSDVVAWTNIGSSSHYEYFGNLNKGTTYYFSIRTTNTSAITGDPRTSSFVAQDTFYTKVRMASAYPCALGSHGRIKCWGYNNNNSFGLGIIDYALGDEPGEMGANLPYLNLGTGVKAADLVSSGATRCAILTSGDLKCWGYSSYGDAGQGHTDVLGDDINEMGDNLPTVDLGSGRTVKSLAMGAGHACAILDNDTVKCWGANGSGQLGYGHTNNIGDSPGEMGDNLPTVDLGTGRTAKFIGAGGNTSCAILDNDQLKCWGDNSHGQLGQEHTLVLGDEPGEMGDNLPAVNLGTGRTGKFVELGSYIVCTILDNDQLKCWGYNGYGGLGQPGTYGHAAGTMGDNLAPIDLGTGRTAKQVSTEAYYTCAILDDDQLKCWGGNGWGQHGREDTITLGATVGDMGDNLPATNVGTGRTVTSVATDFRYSCASLDDGKVKCFGENLYGKLGQGSDGGTIGGNPGDMGDNLPAIDL